MRATLIAVMATLALAAPSAFSEAAQASGEFDKYALESASASLSTGQAGAHADFTIAFKLTEKENNPYALTRDVEFHLPPGVFGNPQAVPRCTVAQLGSEPIESECPLGSQVGITKIGVGEPFYSTFTEPVYNMTPPGGGSDVVARFGFFAALYPAFVNVRVDPTDYSLIASVEGAPSSASLLGGETTIWGVPGASVNDELRLTPLEALEHQLPASPRPTGLPEAPFLSNPTDCGLSRQVGVTARSYQLPGEPSTLSVPFPQVTGCSKLSFEPKFNAIPTNAEASAPTGLDATLTVPQDETPQGLATSAMKGAVVTLPDGMTINPSAADGLAACSREEVGFGSAETSHCPDAAEIGEAEIEVPALEHVLHGTLYQRRPEGGRLFGFWLTTDEQGVHLRLPAEIQPDPVTGQLTNLFLGIPSLGGNPQLPFQQLRLHVTGGPRAPLTTPAGCGTYTTHYSFAPWSGKPASEGGAPMQITGGCGKGGFAPKLSAGMNGASAGSFGRFVFTLTRQEGEANPAVIALHLPQGLLAKLGGVPLCPDAQAGSGACPASSQIGTIAAATGAGGAPLWIPQPGKYPTVAYLAGPYKGAPYSIISVVPAQAGPFDLGTVVNRAAVYVDPETALATIKTDRLPQILEGVPVSYRTVHVEVTRPGFTLNPTSCKPKDITATVTAADGATADPSDDFQATNCAGLPYRPRLKIAFKGPTNRTGNPAIRAVLTQKPHQANTRSATVILPGSEFIDQAHISSPCTRVQFSEERCPKASILGHAKAITPLLSKPLHGPVYFRSNGGERELPDIVADLKGQIHIVLVGYIDSVRRKGAEVSRVRTRFARVPDAPVTEFTMNLYGGERGLIENSRDICKSPLRPKFELRAHNERVRRMSPAIKVDCAKPQGT